MTRNFPATTFWLKTPLKFPSQRGSNAPLNRLREARSISSGIFLMAHIVITSLLRSLNTIGRPQSFLPRSSSWNVTQLQIAAAITPVDSILKICKWFPVRRSPFFFDRETTTTEFSCTFCGACFAHSSTPIDSPRRIDDF